MILSKSYFWIVILCLLSGGIGFFLSVSHHSSPPPIQTIHTSHSPVTFVDQIKNDPDAGRKIFLEFCVTCHGKEPIIDIKAPRVGDKKIWRGLKQLGMPTLLQMTINGAGAMPARGGCFECSDEQLLEAIQYMIKY